MKRLIQVSVILLLVFSMFACTKKADPKVGDAYQGGIIFYILEEGDTGYDSKTVHGLIAATEDQGTATWSLEVYPNDLVLGTLTSIGSGSVNTDKIIAQNGVGDSYAAGLAGAYRGGGYSDWYLPSIDELTKLYYKKDIVGGFKDSLYLSSSEKDAYTAFGQWIDEYLKEYEFVLKSAEWYVRAIRAF